MRNSCPKDNSRPLGQFMTKSIHARSAIHGANYPSTASGPDHTLLRFVAAVPSRVKSRVAISSLTREGQIPCCFCRQFTRRMRNSFIREKLCAFLRITSSASFLGTFPIEGKALNSSAKVCNSERRGRWYAVDDALRRRAIYLCNEVESPRRPVVSIHAL